MNPSIKRKSLGQVFLNDRSVADHIVSSACITENDTILEIGPGKGVLTYILLDKVKRLYAIEKDIELYNLIKKHTKSADNLTLLNDDALFFDYTAIAEQFKVVANLPYSVSTPLILRLIDYREMISSMTLMLQKEVAERIVSPAGGRKYGRLSILIQIFYKASLLFHVKKDRFSPVPKVDSSVIQLNRLEKPLIAIKDNKTFLRLLEAAFGQRRKTLKNSLKSLNLPEGLLNSLLKECGINPTDRAERLTIEDFGRMSNYLGDHIG